MTEATGLVEPRPPETAAPDRPAAAQSWTALLVLYGITSLVEALGISQVFAFMPMYLRGMGVAQPQVGPLVGLFSALVFVLGLPLVPLWGVWADKYSRKAVIIRSAVVEAVVFAGVAASREPWQLGLTLLLVGFQLGNTGVMLAALRDVTPRRRLGTAVAIFSMTSPVGFAMGQALGGFMIDGLRLPVSAIYLFSAVLSVGVAVMLAVGSREVRPSVVPTASVRALAYGAIRGVLRDPVTRRLFALFGLALLARQMTTPFVPLLVQGVAGTGPGLASAIALVGGPASLVGALVSPVAGAVGDRVGFRPVLLASLVSSGIALAFMPLAPSVAVLAMVVAAFAAFGAATTSMVFGLLAVEVPSERRSTTLNLVFLPLYLAGIVGPALGGAIAGASVPWVFVVAATILGLGALLEAARTIHGARLAAGPHGR